MQDKILGEWIFARIHAGPVFALARIQENIFEGSSQSPDLPLPHGLAPSETMVWDHGLNPPLSTENPRNEGFSGSGVPIFGFHLVSRTPRPRGRGRPLFAEITFRILSKFLREFISVQIHVAPVFAPVRIQENIPGELFTYWFRGRGYSLGTSVFRRTALGSSCGPCYQRAHSSHSPALPLPHGLAPSETMVCDHGLHPPLSTENPRNKGFSGSEAPIFGFGLADPAPKG